ncbi:hypothetical protein BD779DRAFT_298645 [Infundibulicybe gibba]|nr:hypothetical protein BD779DRAFT_298645 [Infundibulicybe gibba]
MSCSHLFVVVACLRLHLFAVFIRFLTVQPLLEHVIQETFFLFLRIQGQAIHYARVYLCSVPAGKNVHWCIGVLLQARIGDGGSKYMTERVGD